MKRVWIFSIFLMIIASCDYPIFVHYTVHNNTKDTIAFRYTYQTNEFSRTSNDSVLNILPGSADTLFTFRSISSRVYLPEDSDTLKYLKNVEMNGSLTELSPKIFITKNWKFIQTKRNVARFEFQIK